jgi:glycosyltransferase involved in cell wall biosynthesis
MASAAKLAVLLNGVDVEAWRPDAEIRTYLRRELGLESEFLWFAAGRLEPVKDYPALLSAMAGLPQPSRLMIAGSGPLQNELLRLSKRHGLANRVRFLGFEPDVRRWMQAADGFVLTSRWEGLPMGLLEAAACALPAVATDVPGTREAIIDGQTGWLTPPGSVTALRDAMTGLMRTTPEERQAMGARARQRVIEQFSLESVLNRWEALYENLLQRNPKPLPSAKRPGKTG